MVDNVQSLMRRSVECAIMSAVDRVDQEFHAAKDDPITCSLLFCASEATDTVGNELSLLGLKDSSHCSRQSSAYQNCMSFVDST